MKIHCTILRKNGAYKVIHVKPSDKDFKCDKNVYEVRGYRYGKILGFIPWLTAYYVEDYPFPIDIDNMEMDKAMKKAKIRIDAKGIRNLTNKKILNVFGESELTKMEQIIVLIMMATAGLGVINLILLLQILDKLGGI